MTKSSFSVSTAICVEDALKPRLVGTAISMLQGLVDAEELAELEAGHLTLTSTSELLLRIWYSDQSHSRADCSRAILNARTACGTNLRAAVLLSKALVVLQERVERELMTLELEEVEKAFRRISSIRSLLEQLQKAIVKFRKELIRFEADVEYAYAATTTEVQAAGSTNHQLRLLEAAV